MKKIVLRLFFILLLWKGIGGEAFSQNIFEKTYGGNAFEQAVSIQQTYDGGFFICGSVKGTLTEYDYDIFLVKTDSFGNAVWTKIYNGDTSAITTYGSYSIQLSYLGNNLGMALPTNDSGYVIASVTDHFFNFDIWLLKLNSSGDTLWTKFYGDLSASLEEAPFGIIQTADNGYLISAYTDVSGKGRELFLIKTDANGIVQWDTTYGGSGNEDFFTNNIVQTYDGGYALLGTTTSAGNGGRDFYLLKIVNNGDSLWAKTFGTSGDDIPAHIAQTADSGFVLLGNFDTASTVSKLTLIKTDKDGNFLWEKHPARKHLDAASYFCITPDNGLVITGWTLDSVKNLDVLLVRTDANGDTLWTKNFGGALNDYGIAIAKTADSGFAIAANTDGFGIPTNDIYLIKTDSNGNVVCPETAFAASDTVFCGNKAVNFINTTVGTSSFTWLNNGNVFSSDINSAYFFDTSGTYNIQLMNCTDTSSLPVVSYPIPSAAFSFAVKKDTVTFYMDDSAGLLSFSWDFGDNTIDATNKTPVHRYDSVGIYAVSLSVTDLNGCTDSSTQQVSILPDGISEFRTSGFGLVIYPNPYTSSAIIKVKDFKSDNLNLKLYDIWGKEVHHQKLNTEYSSLNTNLPAGIYFYKIHTEKREVFASGKLIIE